MLITSSVQTEPFPDSSTKNKLILKNSADMLTYDQSTHAYTYKFRVYEPQIQAS